MKIDLKWFKNQLPEDAYYVRQKVFIEEQEIMPEEELDEQDYHCEHLVVYGDNKPVATGRLIIGDRGEILAGRVACLKECRGKGIGGILLKELLRRAEEKGFDEIYLHSQLSVRGFYENYGFKGYGDIYMEANIPHISMKKSFKN